MKRSSKGGGGSAETRAMHGAATGAELPLDLVTWERWARPSNTPRARWFAPAGADATAPDLVVLSQGRWSFLPWRSQQLLRRAAAERRVFFVEPPRFAGEQVRLAVEPRSDAPSLVQVTLPQGLGQDQVEAAMRAQVEALLIQQNIQLYALWYDSPMPLGFSDHLEPLVTIYDCLEGPCEALMTSSMAQEREGQLLSRAGVVLTGEHSRFSERRIRSGNVHPVVGGIDVAHFQRARGGLEEPLEQASLPHPRIGILGPIDARLDLELISTVAKARPTWQVVMLGPVERIDPRSLPRARNLHYFGPCAYHDLPAYLGGWDVALLPMVRQAHPGAGTPMRALEYLAAGLPVVATRAPDLTGPFEESGLFQFGQDPQTFVACVEAALQHGAPAFEQVDAFLSRHSCEETWKRIGALIEEALDARNDEVRRQAHSRGADFPGRPQAW